MLVVSEALAPSLLTVEDALRVVHEAFAALDRDGARSFPVVREALGHAEAVFGIKSGFDRDAKILGLKAGGYWPRNRDEGNLTNHQSAIALFDADTGALSAIVGGNYLTGVRTGAASAIATRYLARPDASVLGILGTGAQARYQLEAILAVRPIQAVWAWDPASTQLEAFAAVVKRHGIDFHRAATVEEAVRAADVLVTVTPARAPLVRRSWVRPGTHINAMGADTAGKQELDEDLVASCMVHVDSPEQAAAIGECQHAVRSGRLTHAALTRTLGGLASGRIAGREDADSITLFDGTGIALQDLAVAAEVVRRADARGVGLHIDFQGR